MFYLSAIEHTLRLAPHLLSLPLNEAIKGELEGLFVDKVIANLGLVIAVYDIRSIDGGFIYPSEGASTYTVKFRLVVFRPFVGEVITARLKESNAEGLRLSLGFFDDIYVPAPLMPNPSRCETDPENKNQVKWIWKFDEQDYPIDNVDEIRFQVHNVSYPSMPLEQDKDSKPFAPMVIKLPDNFVVKALVVGKKSPQLLLLCWDWSHGFQELHRLHWSQGHTLGCKLKLPTRDLLMLMV